MKTTNWLSQNLKSILAIMIMATWVAAMFLNLKGLEYVTNIVMILVGYYWGSSSGSHQKDETIKDIKTKE